MKDSITTQRFYLRPITIDDVTERYVDWFKDEDIIKFIKMSKSKPDLMDLQKYVISKLDCENVFFLGIFEKYSNNHIGNLKFEPVSIKDGNATFGIMIGEKEWRGKGVASEVLNASIEWLYQYRGIRLVGLGVDKNNLSAIRAYEKSGFVVDQADFIITKPGDITMIKKMT